MIERNFKSPLESFADYKQRVIDPISPSFCAAKWLQGTLWLGQGSTASCPHPPTHKISLDEIKVNPAALHNTKIKIEARKQMLTGVRPPECSYCWKVEDLNKDLISDRVYKTGLYTDDDVRMLATADPAATPIRSLEIAFDRTCNFACSYCSPVYSSVWVHDIDSNGPYHGLDTDARKSYQSTSPWAQLYKKDENPYIDAFWKWWPQLYTELDELRVTGGEPLLNKEVWRLIDWMSEHQREGLRFAINSNLGVSDDLIVKLITKSKSINDFHLFTSCEAYGAHAEYIRDGMNFAAWQRNMERFVNEGNAKHITVMMTVNALCLHSIDQLIDWLYMLKHKKHELQVSINIMRTPEYQSVNAISPARRKQLAQRLSDWWDPTGFHRYFWPSEKEQIERMIAYISNTDVDEEYRQKLEVDFWNFYAQYDTRRGKSLATTFTDTLI